MQDLKKEISSVKEEMHEVKKSVQPAVDAISASKVIGKFVTWLAGVILAMGALWLFFKQIVKEAIK
jgi:hypothetical protein